MLPLPPELEVQPTRCDMGQLDKGYSSINASNVEQKGKDGSSLNRTVTWRCDSKRRRQEQREHDKSFLLDATSMIVSALHKTSFYVTEPQSFPFALRLSKDRHLIDTYEFCVQNG